MNEGVETIHTIATLRGGDDCWFLQIFKRLDVYRVEQVASIQIHSKDVDPAALGDQIAEAFNRELKSRPLPQGESTHG